LQVQLQATAPGTVLVGENVLFDTIINAPTTSITYSPATGIFSINEVGNYYISWWVNTDGAEEATFVSFGIDVVDGATISASSPAPVVTLQLNGSALISVTTVPTVFSLVNNSAAPVTYGLSPIQANLTIIEVA
jgi:hypothetical protein